MKHLRKIVEAEKSLGLKINPKKYELFILGDVTVKRRSTILASFEKICPGIKTPTKEELIILGSSLGPKSKVEVLEKRLLICIKFTKLLRKWMRITVFIC